MTALLPKNTILRSSGTGNTFVDRLAQPQRLIKAPPPHTQKRTSPKRHRAFLAGGPFCSFDSPTLAGVVWFSGPLLSMAHAQWGTCTSSLKAKQNQTHTSRVLSETTWGETTWGEIMGYAKYNSPLDPTRHGKRSEGHKQIENGGLVEIERFDAVFTTCRPARGVLTSSS